MLGKGAFGKVNLGMHKLTGKMVAIKSISKEYLTDESSKRKVMQEFGFLKLMRHPSVIRLYETFESNKHILFIIELCSGGDLLNYVRRRRKLKEDTAKFVFRQLIAGLQYCHSKSVLHRDIKLDNVLLNGVGDLKICDFGVSKCVKKGEIMTEQCGTPAYIAPEILRDKGYEGFGADIWSAGVALYAMLYGTVPFKGGDMKELQRQILKGRFSLKDEVSESARDLIKRMLDCDPRKRATIPDIMAHPWMQNVAAHVSLFSEAEKEAIRKEYSCKRKVQAQGQEVTETGTLFTEQNIDSTQNDLTRNNTEKSVILAPFNSTESVSAGPIEIRVALPVRAKKETIRFAAKARDADRQYEKNNNGDVDNGVFNKSACQEEEAPDSPSSLNASFESGNVNNNPTERMLPTKFVECKLSEQTAVDEIVVKRMEEFGFPRAYTMSCLEANKLNHATATYYLLASSCS